MKHAMRFFVVMLCLCSPADAQSIIWEQAGGLNSMRVTHVVTNASGHVFAVTDSGLFRSTDDGASWTESGLSGLSYSYLSSMVVDSEDRIFAITYDDSSRAAFVVRSTDNGDTWTILGNGWSVCFGGSLCFAPAVRIAVNTQQHLFAALYHYAFNDYHDDGIWRSTDHGLTWDSLGILGYPTGYTSLEIDRNNNVFAGILPYYPVPFPRVFRSTDNGSTWARADSGLSDPVNCLAFNSLNDAYAGSWNATNGYSLYQSTDNGFTWSFSDTVGATISAMVFDDSDVLFVATDGGGVYRDGIQVNSGLTDLAVTSLAVSSTGYLYAGTATSGVFRSALPTVDVFATSGGGPESFFLYQNYPNPFNPSTEIGFRIPEAGHVRLQIYDQLGRLIATLVNGMKSAGENSITWEASDKSSGVYFCRLEAGEFTSVRRLVLLR